MREKRTINLAVPEDLLEQFTEICAVYGHGKQKGMVLSAAILMFLKADPRAQGRCLEEVLQADVSQGVERLLERVRIEQGLQIATTDALKASSTPAPAPGSKSKAAKAAKKRRTSKRAVKKLPRLKG